MLWLFAFVERRRRLALRRCCARDTPTAHLSRHEDWRSVHLYAQLVNAALAAGCAYVLNAGSAWLCAGAVGVSRDTRLGTKTGAVFTLIRSGSALRAVADMRSCLRPEAGLTVKYFHGMHSALLTCCIAVP